MFEINEKKVITIENRSKNPRFSANWKSFFKPERTTWIKTNLNSSESNVGMWEREREKSLKLVTRFEFNSHLNSKKNE